MTKPDGSPVEHARTWLLAVLAGGRWVSAVAIEAMREAAGVSARALTTARGRLVQDGRIEKHKAGRGAVELPLGGAGSGSSHILEIAQELSLNITEADLEPEDESTK